MNTGRFLGSKHPEPGECIEDWAADVPVFIVQSDRARNLYEATTEANARSSCRMYRRHNVEGGFRVVRVDPDGLVSLVVGWKEPA